MALADNRQNRAGGFRNHEKKTKANTCKASSERRRRHTCFRSRQYALEMFIFKLYIPTECDGSLQ